MPNGYDYSEQRHGPHDYGDDPHHTYDCKYKCGCSMGPSSSHGLAGVDPFGECPGNPLETKSLPLGTGLAANIGFVITRRIKLIEARMHKAEGIVKRTRPSKKQLDEQNQALQTENSNLRNRLRQISRLTECDKE